MATDRRIARVAELVKREVSIMIQQDIKDDRVGVGMASITEVVMSGDLQHARIFVSIYGTEEARKETMIGLAAATGFIRREIGQRVGLRRTPEIVFEEDRSFERGVKVLSLINQLSAEREARESSDTISEVRDLETNLEQI
jgi:ribosome-binding factor A